MAGASIAIPFVISTDQHTRSKSLKNLVDEEKKLDQRKLARAKRLSRNKVINSHDFMTQKVTRAEVVLAQYKTKLALFVVDELGKASKAMEGSFSSSSSEIGLSIDEEPSQDSDYLSCSTAESENIIKSLFLQVTNFVPSDIRKRLGFKDNYFFFELLAEHFSSKEMNRFVASSLMLKCHRLFSLETFPALFALLFHKFLLRQHASESSPEMRVLLKGLSQIFTHDVTQRSQRLKSVFINIKDEQQHKEYESLPEINAMLAKFYFYYCSSDVFDLSLFLTATQIPFDDFVVVVCAALDDFNGSVLAHYLESITKLKTHPGFKNLRQSTLNKLQSVLHSQLSKSDVAAVARKSLDVCFPAARWFSRMFQLEILETFTFATQVVRAVTLSPLSFLSWRSR